MLLLAIFLSVLRLVTAGHSPDEWRSRTIYQVLTDRFANPNDPNSGCDNLGTYCGGTWNGLASKLDYIADLGFDAIWISPVIENTPNGYHGYWAKNLSAAEVEENRKHYSVLFDPKEHQEAVERGDRRLSYKALQASLLIMLYQNEPILQLII